jgi:hypothetical protein
MNNELRYFIVGLKFKSKKLSRRRFDLRKSTDKKQLRIILEELSNGILTLMGVNTTESPTLLYPDQLHCFVRSEEKDQTERLAYFRILRDGRKPIGILKIFSATDPIKKYTGTACYTLTALIAFMEKKRLGIFAPTRNNSQESALIKNEATSTVY